MQYIDVISKQYQQFINKKESNTKTNESISTVVNLECAKFGVDKLKVILIFNKFNPSMTISEITNSISETK